MKTKQNAKYLAELFDHPVLVISPIIGAHTHEVEVREGKPTNAKGVLADTLKSVDFRNLDNDGQWLIRGTLSGPSVDANPLELLAPSFFVSMIRNPEGRWLDFKEVIDACQKIALDADVSYVRVESKLASTRVLQGIADQATLPNGIPAAGIMVRAEDAPWLAVKFDNEALTKGSENEEQE